MSTENVNEGAVVTPDQQTAPQKRFKLRNFRKGNNDKIITSINKKIYFAKDQNITPGFYVGAIIEEYPKHGVMDTLPMAQLPVEFWVFNQVGGCFVQTNKETRELKVFVSKAPENRRNDDEPVFITQMTEKEAKDIWGENYLDEVVETVNGVKNIDPDGYTPFEKLAEYREKLVKEEKKRRKHDVEEE